MSRDPTTRFALPSLTFRQYAGVAVVAVAYLGGIGGWTYAALQVEAEPPDGVQERVDDRPHPATSTHNADNADPAAHPIRVSTRGA